MLKIFIIGIFLLSMNAFSQSYFVLENGITLTVDKSGYVYDFGHYTPVPRVTVKGGQYLVEDANVIVTIDDQGSPFRKYEILPKEIKGKGFNYFIGTNGVLYTIDSMGIVALIEGDTKILNASKFGGNFFIVDEEIYVVSNTGAYFTVAVEGLKASDIIAFGGNYFMTNRGVLYTVSVDGKIVSKAQNRVGIIVKKGGNYFVDTTGMLYTIADDGSLKMPALPVSLRIQAMSRLGANYFMDGNGKLFTVDKEGNIFERWMNYDLKLTKIISL
jgi:hypothetical protein